MLWNILEMNIYPTFITKTITKHLHQHDFYTDFLLEYYWPCITQAVLLNCGAKELSAHLWPFKPVIGQSTNNIEGVLEQMDLNMIILNQFSQNESFLIQLQNLIFFICIKAMEKSRL